MSDPLHQTLMCTLKGKTLAYIVNVIPIMSERAIVKSLRTLSSFMLAERARVNIERRWHCAPN